MSAPFRTVSPFAVFGVVPRVVHLVGRYSVQVCSDTGRERLVERPRRSCSFLERTAAMAPCEEHVVHRLCGRPCASPLS